MTSLELLFASTWGALLIFCLRILDVSLDTMRVLFAIRGKRGIAGVLGFFMALMWIFAAGNAMKHLDSPLHVLGYAAGYGTGTFVGITIERLVAYGLAMVRIISRTGGVEIAEALRDRGYGVTEMGAFGRDGRVEVLLSVVQRSHIGEVLALVDAYDPSAFVTVEDPKILRGGRFADRTWTFRVPGAYRRTAGAGGKE